MTRDRVRIAVQRSGRLSDSSLDLLKRCGFDFENSRSRLTWRANDFPLEVMLLRHDDIPEYVLDGVCELGIVGTNAWEEGLLRREESGGPRGDDGLEPGRELQDEDASQARAFGGGQDVLASAASGSGRLTETPTGVTASSTGQAAFGAGLAVSDAPPVLQEAGVVPPLAAKEEGTTGASRSGRETSGDSIIDAARPTVEQELGVGRCRLSIAVPDGMAYQRPADLEGKRIATSYPRLLRRWLGEQGVRAEAVSIRGSVELAPALGIGDAICDLVASGQTLATNGLRETDRLLDCESVVVKTGKPIAEALQDPLRRVLQRIRGVLLARRRKYLMMHAPKEALEELKTLFPGMEEPTILPLGNRTDRFAVHAVAGEDVFWETMERLKALGASSILVMPIEKVVD